MANDEEVIKRQMEETRSSLAEKLESLENKVVDTVTGATDAVTGTVESVKDAVQETVGTVRGTVTQTVESIRDTFNLRLQMERHPWLILGGAVGVGFVVGRMLPRARGPGHRMISRGMNLSSHEAPRPMTLETPRAPEPEVRRASADAIGASARKSWLGDVGRALEPEINRLKGMAIGAGMAFLRNFVSQAVPEHFKSQVHEMIDNVTQKLGGQKVDDPGFGPGRGREQERSGFGDSGQTAGTAGRSGYSTGGHG